MLPAERAARVGEKLANLFGLPFWQMTQTATDANRAALRWARAITGRARMLVFDGCYHGTVDETLVRALPEMKDKGGTRARAGLIGMNHDVSATTDAVPFNDIAALERVLARGRTAAVIAEPVMTNIGMVLPEEGFLRKLRELTRRHGALLIIDETHTLSTARGGYARAADLRARHLGVRQGHCRRHALRGVRIHGRGRSRHAPRAAGPRRRPLGHGHHAVRQCAGAGLPRSQPRRAHDPG